MISDDSSYKKLRLGTVSLVLVVTLQFRLCVNRETPLLLTGCAARGTGLTCSAVRGVVPYGRTWEAWPNHRVGPRLSALRLFLHPGCSIHRLFHQCAEWALLRNEIISLQCDGKEATVMITDGSCTVYRFASISCNAAVSFVC